MYWAVCPAVTVAESEPEGAAAIMKAALAFPLTLMI